MRYPEAETAEKHQRILESAAELFRERGLAGVSVSEVMKAAGLTHGAFYNHFASKDALIAETIGHASKQSVGRVGELPASKEGLEAYVSSYLSLGHLESPGEGCVMAALATEIAHEPSTKASFTNHFRMLLGSFVSRFPWKSEKTARSEAIRLLSGMVGAMVLARAMDDKALAAEILDEARKSIG